MLTIPGCLRLKISELQVCGVIVAVLRVSGYWVE